jgi:hypothetical protein
MRRKVDKMPREQPFSASEQCKKDIYGKFFLLGANVDRLERLGLAVPELEQLLERLESAHENKLVRFISTLKHAHPKPDDSSCTSADSNSNKVLKKCPRCTRELTDANIIKENSYYIEDFIAFVVVCECGYIREIRKPVSNPGPNRQSTLQEYAYVSG